MPVVQTSLRWILSGVVGESSAGHHVSHQCGIEEDLVSLVRRFWEQEDPFRTIPLYTKAELEYKENIDALTRELPIGGILCGSR